MSQLNLVSTEDSSWIYQLPYGLSKPEARARRWKEITDGKEVPVEVNCFPVRNYDLKRYGNSLKVHWYSRKLKRDIAYPVEEYLNICPVCGRLMKVRYLPGTTWFALCSRSCYYVWHLLKSGKIKNINNLTLEDLVIYMI